MSDDAEEFSVQAVSAYIYIPYYVFGACHILGRILNSTLRGVLNLQLLLKKRKLLHLDHEIRQLEAAVHQLMEDL
jgi:hypothetical protein